MKFAPFALLLLLAGCGFESAEVGPMHNEPVTVPLGKADRLNLELNMGAGEIKVSGGASDLIDGEARYNVAGSQPDLTSTLNGTHATVTLRQESKRRAGRGAHNEWNLRLNDQALLDLAVRLGAGQARLHLGSVLMRSVEVNIGAGQLDLDLDGSQPPAHDYEVNIHGGVGQATIQLPHGVGVWAQTHGGIGEVSVTGLEKRGDHWENELYQKAKVSVKVNVQGGIGQIRIRG